MSPPTSLSSAIEFVEAKLSHQVQSSGQSPSNPVASRTRTKAAKTAQKDHPTQVLSPTLPRQAVPPARLSLDELIAAIMEGSEEQAASALASLPPHVKARLWRLRERVDTNGSSQEVWQEDSLDETSETSSVSSISRNDEDSPARSQTSSLPQPKDPPLTQTEDGGEQRELPASDSRKEPLDGEVAAGPTASHESHTLFTPKPRAPPSQGPAVTVANSFGMLGDGTTDAALLSPSAGPSQTGQEQPPPAPPSKARVPLPNREAPTGREEEAGWTLVGENGKAIPAGSKLASQVKPLGTPPLLSTENKSPAHGGSGPVEGDPVVGGPRFVVLFRPTEGAHFPPADYMLICRALATEAADSAADTRVNTKLNVAAVTTEKEALAKRLLAVTRLAGIPVKAAYPTPRGRLAGVIRGLPPSVDTGEILDILGAQVRIVSSQRFSGGRNLRLHFEENRPAFLRLWGRRVVVEEEAVRPRQCYRCARFGHVAATCTASHCCHTCQGRHDDTDCPRRDRPRCPNCGLSHSALDKQCPTYQLEKRAAAMMAATGCSRAYALRQERQQHLQQQQERPAPLQRPPGGQHSHQNEAARPTGPPGHNAWSGPSLAEYPPLPTKKVTHPAAPATTASTSAQTAAAEEATVAAEALPRVATAGVTLLRDQESTKGLETHKNPPQSKTSGVNQRPRFRRTYTREAEDRLARRSRETCGGRRGGRRGRWRPVQAGNHTLREGEKHSLDQPQLAENSCLTSREKPAAPSSTTRQQDDSPAPTAALDSPASRPLGAPTADDHDASLGGSPTASSRARGEANGSPREPETSSYALALGVLASVIDSLGEADRLRLLADILGLLKRPNTHTPSAGNASRT